MTNGPNQIVRFWRIPIARLLLEASFSSTGLPMADREDCPSLMSLPGGLTCLMSCGFWPGGIQPSGAPVYQRSLTVLTRSHPVCWMSHPVIIRSPQSDPNVFPPLRAAAAGSHNDWRRKRVSLGQLVPYEDLVLSEKCQISGLIWLFACIQNNVHF